MIFVVLSMAGLDDDALLEKLQLRFTEAHPLVGVDLAPFLIPKRNGDAGKTPTAVYCRMSDHSLRGRDPANVVSIPNFPVGERIFKLRQPMFTDVQFGATDMEVVIAESTPQLVGHLIVKKMGLVNDGDSSTLFRNLDLFVVFGRMSF